MTKVLSCKCKHEGQDALHGAGNRVHNQCQKKGKVGEIKAFACTVCGNLTTKGE